MGGQRRRARLVVVGRGSEGVLALVIALLLVLGDRGEPLFDVAQQRLFDLGALGDPRRINVGRLGRFEVLGLLDLRAPGSDRRRC